MNNYNNDVLNREIARVVNLVKLKPGRTCKELRKKMELLSSTVEHPNRLPSEEGLIWKLMFAEQMGLVTCLYGKWFVMKINEILPGVNNEKNVKCI